MYVCLHDLNSNFSFDYNFYIRISVLTLFIIAVNDSKTITTIGNKSFSTRSLTPIIDRKDKKLVGKGTKMRIVKDFAKFPPSAIKIEKGKKITKKSSVSGDIENSVTINNGKFPNNVTTHLLVADKIENNEVLNEGEGEGGEKEEQDELVQESINQVSMSTTHLNAPFKNDIISIEKSDSITNSENPLEKNINIINYELLKNEKIVDYDTNDQTKNESIVHGKNKNENENDDVNKNENKFISTLVNVEDKNVSLLINRDKTTLLTNSIVTSSHQNILKSEIASNCMENEHFSTVNKCDTAITNEKEKENENENENENESVNENKTLITVNRSNFVTVSTSDNIDKILDASINEIDKENLKETENEKINQNNDNDNDNDDDNVIEMEENNKDNNFDNNSKNNPVNNNTNINIETEKNSESVSISSIKKSVSISINEPSRTFFNSHSPSNSNSNLNLNSNLNSNLNKLNLNNSNVTSNNNNINLNNIRSDVVPLDQSEHNNIELNTVIDCPLVEGLGQEDAFKPRRSSIKVSVPF